MVTTHLLIMFPNIVVINSNSRDKNWCECDIIQDLHGGKLEKLITNFTIRLTARKGGLRLL